MEVTAMSRMQKNPRLQSRDARAKLPVASRGNREPHWHEIYRGLSVGYYKGPQGGRWLVRRYVGGKYQREAIGTADDHADPDGVTVFSFAQAQKIAMGERTPEQQAEKTQDGDDPSSSGYTVEQACDDYLDGFGGKSYDETKRVIDASILPKLGTRPVSGLTVKELRKWRDGLVQARRKRDQIRDGDDPAEWTRKRRATANRALTVLKAALNRAYYDDSVSAIGAWAKVEPFREVDEPRHHFLTCDQSIRLVNACDPEIRPLARAALLTGGRYGELTQMKVGDYHPDAGTVYFSKTKGGKARHVPLTDEGVQFFQNQTAGRTGGELMFTRADGSSWKKSQQARPIKEACDRAKIEPRVSFHGLRHVYGSLLAREGVSLQVIAKLLGHADTRVTERHYAHLQPDHVSEALRAALPEFGGETSNVTGIDRART